MTKQIRPKRTALALNSSAEFNRELREIFIDNSPDALIAVTRDSAILFWNSGAEAVYGYTKAEAIGRRLHDLVAPAESLDESKKMIREAVTRGVVVYETIRRRKDGSAIYVDSTAKAVRDDRNQLRFIALSQKDVTRLKVLSHGKILENKYQGLLETVPDAIIMVNNTGRIVLINQQAEKLFGYNKAALLGMPIEVLLPVRFREDHVAHRTRYYREPNTRAMGAGLELFALGKDGTEFPVEISLSPLRTDDGVFAMSAIRDITERKKLQQELYQKNQALAEQNRRVQEANRLKSEFLANMSHELRTPLNGIIGFAEIMHDGRVGPISEQHKEYLGDILTSARHLLQLINDVLDLSKVEAGKMEFHPQPLNLPLVVQEVREIVRTLAARKRIEVRSEIDPALASIDADSRSIKQILYNYLSNALKFTPERGTVTVRGKVEDAHRFRIEVEDSGIGISAGDLDRLFVEFQQLDSSAAKKYAGTGLGLALTRKIVEAQGGSVGVTSTPGKGSVFYTVLPRVFRFAGAARPEKEAVKIAAGDPTVLVVEDDANDRAWIAGALRKSGYAVETVATGSEALIRCREQRFDAITLDIMLPDMSGRAVLEKLRERGLNQETPVVVVTVLAQKGIVAGYQVIDILAKPVSEGEIVKALERCGIAHNSRRSVLVIDDDASALKVADHVLRQLGFRPVCRQDAASALKAASTERPAAVVLDLMMPEMNGFEFLKRFRKTPNGRRTPVIVWTGKDLTETERAALRSSVSSIAKKDKQANQLIQELNAILRTRSASGVAHRVPS
jgi:PAS domain S-box-containing protein